jgi:hypothetical protein
MSNMKYLTKHVSRLETILINVCNWSIACSIKPAKGGRDVAGMPALKPAIK